MKIQNGLFITFEGGEGSGKTTQLQLLHAYLKQTGYDVIKTREPGGTPIGDLIRKILLHPDNEQITPLAELFLYEASRNQLINEVIRPKLKEGYIVLCDRFTDSSIVYQNYARGISYALVQELNATAVCGIWPHITFVLDIDPEIGLTRTQKRQTLHENRFEEESLQFHQTVRNAYLELAHMETTRFKVFDATLDEDILHDRIIDVVKCYYMDN